MYNLRRFKISTIGKRLTHSFIFTTLSYLVYIGFSVLLSPKPEWLSGITAYDEYAIEAFRVNSIDYLLKPNKEEDLKRALEKFKKLTRHDIVKYLSQMTHLTMIQKYKDKILIPLMDKLQPVDLCEVSCFYTTGKK